MLSDRAPVCVHLPRLMSRSPRASADLAHSVRRFGVALGREVAGRHRSAKLLQQRRQLGWEKSARSRTHVCERVREAQVTDVLASLAWCAAVSPLVACPSPASS